MTLTHCRKKKRHSSTSWRPPRKERGEKQKLAATSVGMTGFVVGHEGGDVRLGHGTDRLAQLSQLTMKTGPHLNLKRRSVTGGPRYYTLPCKPHRQECACATGGRTQQTLEFPGYFAAALEADNHSSLRGAKPIFCLASPFAAPRNCVA